MATLLLVHDAEGPWQLHRDVIEVDGRQVADRRDRLEALFVRPASDLASQLRRITADGARFNLGRVERTINIPTLPLVVLYPTHSGRFRFKDGGAGMVGDVAVRRIVFEEASRPTVVRTVRNRDAPLRVRMWEWYLAPDLATAVQRSPGAGVIEALAEYDQFHRFGVVVDEEIGR